MWHVEHRINLFPKFEVCSFPKANNDYKNNTPTCPCFWTPAIKR